MDTWYEGEWPDESLEYPTWAWPSRALPNPTSPSQRSTTVLSSSLGAPATTSALSALGDSVSQVEAVSPALEQHNIWLSNIFEFNTETCDHPDPDEQDEHFVGAVCPKPKQVARILVDSGASVHVCPLWFGQRHFPLRCNPEEMKTLGPIWAANGEQMTVHGFRSIHLQINDHLTMLVNFVVLNATNPIISVPLLQKSGITVNFDPKGARLVRDHHVVPLHFEQKLFWLRPQGFVTKPISDLEFERRFASPHVGNLHDHGPKDEWRLEYNILIRIHRRYRKGLYNPAQAVNFPAGVHLGIFGSTRKTFLTFEDGTRETVVDTWSSGERPRIFESWWTGETHFELLVDGQGSFAPDPSPELPTVPPGLEESASSSGSRLSQDDREVSRLNTRRRDSGED